MSEAFLCVTLVLRDQRRECSLESAMIRKGFVREWYSVALCCDLKSAGGKLKACLGVSSHLVVVGDKCGKVGGSQY